LPDAATLDQLRARLQQAGAPIEALASGFETQDPSGNRIQILLAA